MNGYLQHYGIKGQHWGVRRFQNEDGSYTAEGKERYGRLSEDKAGGTSERLLFTAAKNAIKYNARKVRVNRQVKKSQVNAETERVTKDNVKHLARNYNRRETNEILNRMKKDPNMSFKDAERPTAEKRFKKQLVKAAAFLAVTVATPVIVANKHRIFDAAYKTSNEIRRNKTYQSFMKSMKHRRMKNSIVLKDSDYSIDKPRSLPAGRG